MHDLDRNEARLRGTYDFPFEFHHIESNHPRYVMSYHWHVEYEIIRILKGSLTVTLNEKSFIAMPGDIIFVHSGILHSGIPEDCVYQCIVFDGNTFLKYNSVSTSLDMGVFSNKDLEFTEKVLKESRSAYYKAQQAYAAFEDGNKNIISASYRTEQERLRNEMTLTFNVYNTLAQKLEQDKLRVQEQTPVYTIIEPATVPLKASSPKKLLILVAFIFLAFIGGCGYLIIKEYAIPPSPRSET